MSYSVEARLSDERRDPRQAQLRDSGHATPQSSVTLETSERDAVIALARQMQGRGAVADLLHLSAALLEHCAYELARSERRGQVSRIILISAEIERMARDAESQ